MINSLKTNPRKRTEKWYRKRFWHYFCMWYNQKGLCHYCGVALTICHPNNQPNGKDYTLDHMKPLSKGGSNGSFSNHVLACYSCNKHKSNMKYEDFLKSKWLKKKIANVTQEKNNIPYTIREAFEKFKVRYDHGIQSLKERILLKGLIQ